MQRTFFLLLCLLTFSACRISIDKADLVVINGQDPESLDPAVATGPEDFRVIRSLFEGLTRNDAETARAVPGLARSWSISEDGRLYRFQLRENLVWSTGQPITAHDFEWSWLRVLDRTNPADYANLLYYVRHAETYHTATDPDVKPPAFRAVNDLIFEVELENSTPFFLEICAFPTLALVPRWVIEKHGDFWIRSRPLPTCGPYQLVSWRLNDRIRIRKNGSYWDANATLNETVDLLVSSPATALNLYLSGVADIIWDQDMVPGELLPELSKRRDFHTFPFLGTYFLRFNTTRPPFDQAKVRKALSLAIDKQGLIDKIVRGGEQVATHLVPPGVAGYKSPEGPMFSPEEARMALAEAGFPGGEGFPTFEFLYSGSGGGGINKAIAVELQHAWAETLGVRMELRQLEKKVYLANQSALKYDVSSSNWLGDYNDATTFLDLMISNNGNNRTGWVDEDYDRLMERAARESDPMQRAQFLAEAERLLIHETFPVAPLYFFAGFNYYDPDRVKGVHGNILDIHPLQTIRVVEDVETSNPDGS